MVIILGSGKTAQSVHKHFPEYTLIENIDDALPYLDTAEMIVKSPGIPLHHPVIQEALQKKICVVTDVDLFKTNTPIIGVTGTNGKSTVVSMIDHMLKTADIPSFAGGNLGTPVLDMPLIPPHGYYVVELSSYHLELAPILPLHIACLLKITPNHIDHHGSMEAYIKAKYNIFNHAKHKIIADDETTGIEIVEAVGKILEIPDSIIKKSIDTFIPLPHRCEYVKTIGKVQFINDSKATTIEATIAAVKKFPAPIHLILGGLQKIDDFTALIPYLEKIECIYAIGQSAPLIMQQLPKTLRSDTLKNTMEIIFKTISFDQEGIVLLSPACASWDQFKSFEERGEKFKEYISGI